MANPKNGNREMFTHSQAAKYAGVSASTIKTVVSSEKFKSIFDGQTDVYNDPYGRPPINLVSKSAIDAWQAALKTMVADGRGTNRRGGQRFYKIRIPDNRYQDFLTLLSSNGFEAPVTAFKPKAAKATPPVVTEANAAPTPSADVELVEA